ncbi:MAG: hypothetical protein SPK35_06445 [Prevotella sp.]|nr:hypothetical protein [Prevotella sp.]
MFLSPTTNNYHSHPQPSWYELQMPVCNLYVPLMAAEGDIGKTWHL